MNLPLPQLNPKHSFADLTSQGRQPCPSVCCPSAARSRAGIGAIIVPGSHRTGCSEDKTIKSCGVSQEQKCPGITWAVHTGQAVLFSKPKHCDPKSHLELNWCLFAGQWLWFVTHEPVGLSTPGFASLHAPLLGNPEALFCAWRDCK